MARRKASLRLLFDEQMSTGVAKALAILGKPVTYVGAERQPKKGTHDPVVAEAAKRENRAIATFNFDMVLACCDLGARFVWFDQRGKSPTRMEAALIFLRQWDQWETAMAPGTECVKVGRESVEVLSLDQARARALRRFRESQQGDKRAAKKKASTAQQRLNFED
jgi:predicted nuclease of predicted toxin-antitoxin system